jgi:transposase
VDEVTEVERLTAALVAERARTAELEASVAELKEHVAKLEKQLAKALEILGQDSSNSNKPPSSDPPNSKQAKKKKKGRRRGGQKGHRGSRRELLPPEQVDEVVDLFPAECESCWKPLPQAPDSFAKRYQLTELKPLAVHTTEWRRHAVVCPCCGYKTRAKYDTDVIPRFAFGPRLMAVVALLTGVYHLSRRQAVRLLRELLGVRMSLGSVSAIERRVSEAVEPAVDEVMESARAAAVKHADGTTWLRSGALLSLWVVATTAVTVFKVLPNGQKATLRDDLFGRVRGILVSDRATALKFWAMHRRQVCWAHLVRKFASYSERDGPAGELGKELLEYTSLLFEYWSLFRQGQLSRKTFVQRMAPVRVQVEALLDRAVGLEELGVSGSCADILEHREALWTFVEQAGVEPTNNHAERELRGLVMWRRRSFGSQSDRGTHFAARMMTIAHTARKQGREILEFLVACCAPRAEGAAAPSLLASA